MKFGPVPIAEAAGKILGHNIAGADGRRVFRKGRPLSATDIIALAALGRTTVFVADVEPGDIDENSAAADLARALMGSGLRMTGPATGRVNLLAAELGLVQIDVERLVTLNTCAGVTLATLAAHSPVRAGRVVATLKVLPYYLPERTSLAAMAIAGEDKPILWLKPLPRRRVGLILSGSPSAQERITYSFEAALEQRLQALGSTIEQTAFVPLEDDQGEAALVATLQAQREAGMELIILAGETAIMDRHDIAPRAVEQVGGEIICYGAPVDPGNLLMLAYWRQIAVLGAPGCVRSPKRNIVDLILPRLLAEDRLTQADIVAWGHGGLLEDVPERPSPRSRLS